MSESHQAVRPSTFIDMPVNLLSGPFSDRKREMGVVRDVLYTAFEDHGGCINERVKVIVEITSGPRGGSFVATELNKLERR